TEEEEARNRDLLDDSAITVSALNTIQCGWIDLAARLGTALVETVFTLQNTQRHPPAETGFRDGEYRIKPYQLEDDSLKFDLTLDACEVDEGIDMWFTYPTMRLSTAVVEKMREHYQEIIGQVTETPGIKLGDITISHDLTASTSTILQDDEGDFGF
ncbi:MAG: hypothetical protein GY757_08945, partial [bacterium]|nr:hypothetical protein [bacterium]